MTDYPAAGREAEKGGPSLPAGLPPAGPGEGGAGVRPLEGGGRTMVKKLCLDASQLYKVEIK